MAIFATAEEHRANPPETWKVEGHAGRWAIVLGNGDELDRYPTRKAALEDIAGRWGRMYAEWSRWYDEREPQLTGHAPTTPTYGQVCSCARHNDGSVTTSLCPLHAEQDPCLTMATVTGKRRRGSVVRGVCSACGWSAK